MQSKMEPPTLDITVAICTWNRARLLRQTIESMRKMAIPASIRWELLVVNNNSTDETSEVVREFQGQLPIREYFEKTPGKSHALNSGTRNAKGAIIIWTDDDVLVREDWISAYSAAFAKYPDAHFWGGPVEPWFEEPPPQWLEESWPIVKFAYASIDYTGDEALITTKTIPFGVNWAIRRQTQLDYGYDPRLGPRPNSTLRGEETTLIRKLLGDDIPGRWVPQARMQHFVPKDRMTVDFLRGFYFGQGEGIARIERLGLRDMAVPRRWRLIVRYALHYLQFRWKRLIGRNGSSWMPHLIVHQKALGALMEYRRHLIEERATHQ